PRLLQEPGPEYVVGGQFGCQYLQRDDAAQTEVLRLIDHAHAPAAEHRAHPVARELVPHQRKPRHHVLPPRRPPPRLSRWRFLSLTRSPRMGYQARCTGKKGGRQRLAENRNPSLIMERQGPEWNVLWGWRTAKRTTSSAGHGRRGGHRGPFGPKMIFNYPE